MRVAVLADIHGNSAALDAVLSDIARAGADLVVNLGDCLSGPLDALGTADRLAGAGFPTVMGNHDRALIDRPFEEMGSWERPVFPALSAAHLDWLRSLPATLSLEGLFLCHGTPRSDSENWLDWHGPDGAMALAPRAEIEARAEGIAAEGFLCAHTHVPRVVRLADGRPVVNPGSVGLPAWADRRDPANLRICLNGAPDARYAILHRQGRGHWQAELRAVPYDPAPMVALARAAGDADWAEAVSTGWVTPYPE